MRENVEKILTAFEKVTLSELGAAKLMKRTDTKYLASRFLLEPLLEMALKDYRIVEIDGSRLLPYSTLYFDTEDAEMFYEHQRGKKSRQKVRIRTYESSGLSFLEIKDKNNRGHTSKTRMEYVEGLIETDYSEFVEKNSRYEMFSLEKKITNNFWRLTLVKKDFSERVTIDLDIGFRNLTTGLEGSVAELIVIELKRPRVAGESPMRKILKTLGISESGFSKYIVGMAMTDPSLRQNRIKPRLRKIGKIRRMEKILEAD